MIMKKFFYVSFFFFTNANVSMTPCVSFCLNLSAGLPESSHTEVVPGDLLYSPFFTYQVNAVLGKGTYGNVLKCTYMATNVTVAIKMMKNEGFLTEQAASEVSKKFNDVIISHSTISALCWFYLNQFHRSPGLCSA